MSNTQSSQTKNDFLKELSSNPLVAAIVGQTETRIDCMKLLIEEYGVDPKVDLGHGITLVTVAITYRDLDVLKYLETVGADSVNESYNPIAIRLLIAGHGLETLVDYVFRTEPDYNRGSSSKKTGTPEKAAKPSPGSPAEKNNGQPGELGFRGGAAGVGTSGHGGGPPQGAGRGGPPLSPRKQNDGQPGDGRRADGELAGAPSSGPAGSPPGSPADSPRDKSKPRGDVRTGLAGEGSSGHAGGPPQGAGRGSPPLSPRAQGIQNPGMRDAGGARVGSPADKNNVLGVSSPRGTPKPSEERRADGQPHGAPLSSPGSPSPTPGFGGQKPGGTGRGGR